MKQIKSSGSKPIQLSLGVKKKKKQEILQWLHYFSPHPRMMESERQRNKEQAVRSLAPDTVFKPTCHLLLVSFKLKLNSDKYFLSGAWSASGSRDLLAGAACKVCVAEALFY